jgi:hypothetical protein
MEGERFAVVQLSVMEAPRSGASGSEGQTIC